MKIQKLAATLLNVTRLIAFAGLLTLMAGSALADRQGPPSANCADMIPNECYVELSALCSATENAISLKPMNKSGLKTKVLGAAIKLNQDKIGQADQKLVDYETKLGQLDDADKPKISEADANTLGAALSAAQLCVDAQL